MDSIDKQASINSGEVHNSKSCFIDKEIGTGETYLEPKVDESKVDEEKSTANGVRLAPEANPPNEGPLVGEAENPQLVQEDDGPNVENLTDEDAGANLTDEEDAGANLTDEEDAGANLTDEEDAGANLPAEPPAAPIATAVAVEQGLDALVLSGYMEASLKFSNNSELEVSAVEILEGHTMDDSTWQYVSGQDFKNFVIRVVQHALGQRPLVLNIFRQGNWMVVATKDRKVAKHAVALIRFLIFNLSGFLLPLFQSGSGFFDPDFDRDKDSWGRGDRGDRGGPSGGAPTTHLSMVGTV